MRADPSGGRRGCDQGSLTQKRSSAAGSREEERKTPCMKKQRNFEL